MNLQPYLNDVANLLNIEPPKGDLILLMNAHIDGEFGGTEISFPDPACAESMAPRRLSVKWGSDNNDRQ